MKLTRNGKQRVDAFLAECAAKRREVVDAGLDTADETELPTEEDILSDIEVFGDDVGYLNCWGVTDSPKYDLAIMLERDKDYVC